MARSSAVTTIALSSGNRASPARQATSPASAAGTTIAASAAGTTCLSSTRWTDNGVSPSRTAAAIPARTTGASLAAGPPVTRDAPPIATGTAISARTAITTRGSVFPRIHPIGTC